MARRLFDMKAHRMPPPAPGTLSPDNAGFI